jgi:hypothetical protein
LEGIIKVYSYSGGLLVGRESELKAELLVELKEAGERGREEEDNVS